MSRITAEFEHGVKNYFFDPMKPALTDDMGNDVPMPKDLVEFESRRMDMIRNRVRLRINLGTECNFSCAYCIQHSNTNIPKFRAIPAHKISRLVSGIVHYARMAGAADGRVPDVDFIGGEPLLHWEEMKEIISLLRSFFPDAKFAMITNGSLFTADKAKFCLQNNVLAQLSHDGPGQGLRTLDPLAPRSETLAAFQLMAREGSAPMVVNPVLTRHNHDLSEIYEYLCNRLHTEVMISEGFPVEICDEQTAALGFSSLEEYAPMVRETCACLVKHHPAMFQSYFEMLTKLAYRLANRIPPEPHGRCSAFGNFVYALNPDGDVLRCHEEPPDYMFIRNTPGGTTPNSCLSLEDIMRENMTMESISQKLAARNFMADWRHRELCRGCPAVSFCLGGCAKRGEEFYRTACPRWGALISVVLSTLIHCMEPNALSVRVEL